MAIQNWSDEIILAELTDEPTFTEEIASLADMVEKTPRHVVLSFDAVDYLNSSNIAKLLKLRRQLHAAQRRLILSGVNTQVWGVFLVTGLEKIFEYTDDTATALAMAQLGPEA